MKAFNDYRALGFVLHRSRPLNKRTLSPRIRRLPSGRRSILPMIKATKRCAKDVTMPPSNGQLGAVLHVTAQQG